MERTAEEIRVVIEIKFPSCHSSEQLGHDKKKWVTSKNGVESEYEHGAEITDVLKDGHHMAP